MGTYGTATGLVLVIPAAGLPGKLLGLSGGELQAYFDSDGKIKWAGGKGVADTTGVEHVADANNYWKVKPSASKFMEVVTAGGTTYAAIYGQEDTGYGVYGRSASGFGVYGYGPGGKGVRGDSTAGAGVYGYVSGAGKAVQGYASGLVAYGGYFQANEAFSTGLYAEGGKYGISALGTGLAIAAILATGTASILALKIVGGKVDGGSQRYTAMGDATAATDGLNRQSGDARYTGITTGTIDGGTW